MRSFLPLLGLVLACLLGSCFAPTAWVEKSRAEFARGEFVLAFEDLQMAKTQGEDEDAIDEVWWTYRSASLLKQAQRLCFQNEDVAALRQLAKVLAIEPDNHIALAWNRKCKEKLANHAATRGRSKLASGNLKGALEDFHEALSYWPGHEVATDGVALVTEDWNERRDKARGRYIDGVRSLADQRYEQTQWNMSVALDADPTLEPARGSRTIARTELSDMRFGRAREMEEQGYYSAALRDYEAVAEADPDRAGLRERIEFMRREVEAQKIARQGEMALFRGQFREARELLDQAFEMSTSERVPYNDLLLLAREREFDQRYMTAKDLEYQGQLDAAIVKFEMLEKDMPGFKDVKARLYDLHASLEAAEESYKAGLAAQEAGDTAAALDAFRDVLLYVPKFRDTAARIQALSAAKPESDDADVHVEDATATPSTPADGSTAANEGG